jgi:hypothetical protein
MLATGWLNLKECIARFRSEFTMTPFQICERMARKDIGCLPRLLDYGLNSELEVRFPVFFVFAI